MACIHEFVDFLAQFLQYPVKPSKLGDFRDVQDVLRKAGVNL